jgi:hypothetical protein
VVGRRKESVYFRARVGRIGAFGHLAPLAINAPHIRSDEHKHYPQFVEKYFPNAWYERFKGERGAIVGQGELKKVYRDPLFAINHSCAMLRANVNRLIRKTWCTTKKKEHLQMHLDLFIDYYNQIYLN